MSKGAKSDFWVRAMERIREIYESPLIDTVMQKIEAVKSSKTNSIKLSETEFIEFNHILPLCYLIEEGKLVCLEISNNVTELQLKKLLDTVKKCKCKLVAKIQCIQIVNMEKINLSDELKDHPDIECVINFYDNSGRHIGNRIVNPKKNFRISEILSFAPEDSEDDSESDKDDSKCDSTCCAMPGLLPSGLAHDVADVGTTCTHHSVNPLP